MNFKDAAKMWQHIYKSNFYDIAYENQLKWVEAAKQMEIYFREKNLKENTNE